MATFPIKVEKPQMKIVGLNILPVLTAVTRMMPERMHKKSVVKQVIFQNDLFFYYYLLLHMIWLGTLIIIG